MPAQIKTTKRKSFRKRQTKGKLTKSQAVAVKRMISSNDNKKHEVKYFDLEVDSSPDYSGAVVDLMAISNGDTDITRDGDSIYIKSVQWRFVNALADSYNIVRMLFFQYNQDNTPTVDDILSPTWTGDPMGVHSPYRHDTKSTYKILSDRTVLLDADDATALTTGYLKSGFRTRKVQYIGGTTTGINKIWLLVITDSSSVANPSTKGVVRLRFSDA